MTVQSDINLLKTQVSNLNSQLVELKSQNTALVQSNKIALDKIHIVKSSVIDLVLSLKKDYFDSYFCSSGGYDRDALITVFKFLLDTLNKI